MISLCDIAYMYRDDKEPDQLVKRITDEYLVCSKNLRLQATIDMLRFRMLNIFEYKGFIIYKAREILNKKNTQYPFDCTDTKLIPVLQFIKGAIKEKERMELLSDAISIIHNMDANEREAQMVEIMAEIKQMSKKELYQLLELNVSANDIRLPKDFVDLEDEEDPHDIKELDWNERRSRISKDIAEGIYLNYLAAYTGIGRGSSYKYGEFIVTVHVKTLAGDPNSITPAKHKSYALGKDSLRYPFFPKQTDAHTFYEDVFSKELVPLSDIKSLLSRKYADEIKKNVNAQDLRKKISEEKYYNQIEIMTVHKVVRDDIIEKEILVTESWHTNFRKNLVRLHELALVGNPKENETLIHYLNEIENLLRIMYKFGFEFNWKKVDNIC